MNRQQMWTTEENELLSTAISLSTKSLLQGCEEASKLLRKYGFKRTPKACYLHYIKVIRMKNHSIIIEEKHEKQDAPTSVVAVVVARKGLLETAKLYKTLLIKSVKSTETFISDLEALDKFISNNKLEFTLLLLLFYGRSKGHTHSVGTRYYNVERGRGCESA